MLTGTDWKMGGASNMRRWYDTDQVYVGITNRSKAAGRRFLGALEFYIGNDVAALVDFRLGMNLAWLQSRQTRAVFLYDPPDLADVHTLKLQTRGTHDRKAFHWRLGFPHLAWPELKSEIVMTHVAAVSMEEDPNGNIGLLVRLPEALFRKPLKPTVRKVRNGVAEGSTGTFLPRGGVSGKAIT